MLELIEGLAVFNVELFLVLASLGLLLVGAFQKNDNVVLYLSVAAIGFACFLNFVHFSDQMYAFSNMLESNFFIQFGKMLILISSLFVLLIATNETQKFELPILVLLSTSGMLILTSAYNFITLYLGLELMSLPLYILAAFNRNDSRSTEAGLKYFILGAIASGVFLMGTSLIYGFTGAINFGNVYDYYLNLTEGESVSMPLGFLVGMVFVVTAFCFKISAVPFHMWTPDVYQGSPTLITM
ncbi:MAG: NADH-quinone oxidoreductase subunit N, partial [Alphaproteobacteria bacterium]